MERSALDVEPTYFEITTAAAFEIFRQERVDIAVVEVGLGGRLDATNVVAPAVTAITSIDLDHEAHLGPTLAAIATEKAGIIKAGVPVIVGALKPEALRCGCHNRGGKRRAARASDAAGIDVDRSGAGQYRVTIRTNRGTYGPVDLGLRGRHQIGNAVIAALVLEQLPRSLAIDRRPSRPACATCAGRAGWTSSQSASGRPRRRSAQSGRSEGAGVVSV